MKILLTTDWHVSEETPVSRKDKFFSTMMNKIGQLAEICGQRGVDILLVAGDLFHRRKMSEEALIEFIRVVRRIPCRKLLIPGNHDVVWGKARFLDKTLLGLMLEARDVFEKLDVLDLDIPGGRTLHLRGLDFNVSKERKTFIDVPRAPEGSLNFLVGHGYVGSVNAYIDEAVFAPHILEEMGWHLMLCGHDHVEYPPVTPDGKVFPLIFRPGALSRGTKHGYNRVRDVNVTLLTIGESVSWDVIKLDVLPADDIFSEEAIVREGAENRIKDFVKMLQLKNLAGTSNVAEILKRLCGDRVAVYDCCLGYLHNAGVV